MPVIGWIYETLQRDDNGRVARDYFHDKLQADFGDEAEEQLDIAISWGRQAELFAYDADTRELYLESYEGNIAEKSLALAELYETWPVLSRRDRVEGFKLLQRDDAEDARHPELVVLVHAAEVADQRPRRLRDGGGDLGRSAPGPVDDKTRREVKGLLDYAEEHARDLINPRYARLRPYMTVDEAVSFLRRDARDRAQTVYYAYVTDAEERLLGTVTFRDLLITPGDKTVQEVMRTDVITAPEHLNQEALSELFARYNLQMIPVVDSEKRIKGVVSKE